MKAVVCVLVALFAVVALAHDTKKSLESLPSMQCVMCMNVCAMLEALVKPNETMNQFLGTVDTICTRYHVEDWCVANIENRLQDLLPKLEQKLDPRTICEGYKLCSPNGTVAQESVKRSVEETVVKAKREVEATQVDVKCELCEAVLGYVKQYIGSNTSQAAIKAALDKACAAIPFAQELCETVLEPYVIQIVDGFVANQDPEQICQKIKLCNPTQVKREVETVQLNVGCEICEAVLSYVKGQIGSNTTQAAIKAALDKACAKIPFAKNVCSTILEPYLIQIVDGFVANQNPQQICQKIKVCKAQNKY